MAHSHTVRLPLRALLIWRTVCGTAQAKAKAEEEKNVFRHMLELAHERALRERQELRRDAQSKIEAAAARIRSKKQRVASLEAQLHELGQAGVPA